MPFFSRTSYDRFQKSTIKKWSKKIDKCSEISPKKRGIYSGFLILVGILLTQVNLKKFTQFAIFYALHKAGLN
jgi:hypothetical protein